MRKNLGVQPALFPMPVVIVAAYGADGNICAMNAAWAQIVLTVIALPPCQYRILTLIR